MAGRKRRNPAEIRRARDAIKQVVYDAGGVTMLAARLSAIGNRIITPQAVQSWVHNSSISAHGVVLIMNDDTLSATLTYDNFRSDMSELKIKALELELGLRIDEL